MKSIAAIKNLATACCCLLALTAGLSSCSETDDDDNEFANWKERNETYYNSIYQKAKSEGEANGWKVLKKWSLNDDRATKAEDYVVVNVIKEGKGSGCPLYTDSVSVHYRLRYMPTTQHPQGQILQETWKGDYNEQVMVPVNIPVSAIPGWETAVQQMHIGDRWMVYVPYQLAYGESDYTTSTSTIPGGSTLIYDLTLVAYSRAGTALPSRSAADIVEWVWE